MDFTASEKGVPIRMPSTSNLQIDSMDRDEVRNPKPWKFAINRTYSILNGFFTRIATTEVVLEWSEDNIDDTNNLLTFDISGVTPFFNITINSGMLNVAQLLDDVVERLNSAVGMSPRVFSISTSGGNVTLDLSGGQFRMPTTTLSSQLDIIGDPAGDYSTFVIIEKPDLRPWRYLDFISSELTYNQDLKDASTCPIVRDVLCRWYFSWDNPPDVDAYGFPILMGYSPFKARRLFNPPKQIRWDTKQPVGNLSFEVYGQNKGFDTGISLADYYPTSPRSEWLMTLQISEV